MWESETVNIKQENVFPKRNSQKQKTIYKTAKSVAIPILRRIDLEQKSKLYASSVSFAFMYHKITETKTCQQNPNGRK